MWTGGALAKVRLEWSPLGPLSPLTFPTLALAVLALIRTLAIRGARYWLFVRSALSYLYPAACTKHEWNIKNHAKLASVRIASRPSPKFLSSVSP
jgi:hypothetical protein